MEWMSVLQSCHFVLLHAITKFGISPATRSDWTVNYKDKRDRYFPCTGARLVTRIGVTRVRQRYLKAQYHVH